MTPDVRLERARSELGNRGLLIGSRGARIDPSDHRGFGERLVSALPAISPLFTLFGRYLGARTDLLLLRDCRELARLSPSTAPTPMTRVGDALRRLDRPMDRLFSSFDEANRTTLLHQWHDAVLSDGTAVTVKLVRPEARALVDRDLELLPILEELAIDAAAGGAPVEDFVVWLERQFDMGAEGVGLEQLSSEVETFDAFEIPSVVAECTAQDVITTHRIDATRVATLLEEPGDDRPKLARRLCQAWLQQSLIEGTCPEGPLSDHLRIVTNERFAITGGLVTTLDSRWRRNLLEAIIATARDDPDRVCDALVAEFTEQEDAADHDRIRSEFRQAESFRSGGWTDESTWRSFSDGLFVYWRLLGGMGYAPKRHTIALIRGFSELEATARALAPDTDVMADAVDDLRLIAAAVSVRESLGPGALIRAAEELTPVIGELLERPGRGRWARRDAKPGDRPRAEDPPSRNRSWRVFAGSMAVLAAGTILGVAAIRSHPDKGWIEWMVALGFIAACAWVFRLVGSPADR